jgi:hypothetical protein
MHPRPIHQRGAKGKKANKRMVSRLKTSYFNLEFHSFEALRSTVRKTYCAPSAWCLVSAARKKRMQSANRDEVANAPQHVLGEDAAAAAIAAPPVNQEETRAQEINSSRAAAVVTAGGNGCDHDNGNNNRSDNSMSGILGSGGPDNFQNPKNCSNESGSLDGPLAEAEQQAPAPEQDESALLDQQEEIQRKRELNATHSRRTRERARIEHAHLRDQCAQLNTSNMHLYHMNKVLTGLLERAQQIVREYEQNIRNPDYHVRGTMPGTGSRQAKAAGRKPAPHQATAAALPRTEHDIVSELKSLREELQMIEQKIQNARSLVAGAAPVTQIGAHGGTTTIGLGGACLGGDLGKVDSGQLSPGVRKALFEMVVIPALGMEAQQHQQNFLPLQQLEPPAQPEQQRAMFPNTQAQQLLQNPEQQLQVLLYQLLQAQLLQQQPQQQHAPQTPQQIQPGVQTQQQQTFQGQTIQQAMILARQQLMLQAQQQQLTSQAQQEQQPSQAQKQLSGTPQEDQQQLANNDQQQGAQDGTARSGK